MVIPFSIHLALQGMLGRRAIMEKKRVFFYQSRDLIDENEILFDLIMKKKIN